MYVLACALIQWSFWPIFYVVGPAQAQITLRDKESPAFCYFRLWNLEICHH